MRSRAHVDFRAIPSKLNLVHAGGHKINPPSAVFSHILRYRQIVRIKSVSLIPNQDRQRVIGFAGILNVDFLKAIMAVAVSDGIRQGLSHRDMEWRLTPVDLDSNSGSDRSLSITSAISPN
jgi:hypothetical protein